MKIDFNTKILSALLDQNPDKAVAIYTKFPKIDRWLLDTDKPTINQLGNVAHFLNIPFGYFFLKEIPDKKYPIPHFRTIDNQPFRPSQELTDTLETLQERQQWARDILIELLGDPLSFANSLTINSDFNTASQKISEILNLNKSWAESIPTWTDALRLLIEKAEDAGIFVVMNGVVNNNTRRKLDVDEFRGFVLYDEYAPFIFINNNDTISGKIFTIIHEIAHILIGKSASFDLRKLQPSSDDTEKYCDRVAAEFLVPQELLISQVRILGINYQALAKHFKVSRIVIARRLLDINQINREIFFQFYDKYSQEEMKFKINPLQTKKGGNFYNTAPYRISRQFFHLVYNSVKQNKMLYMDAFRLTGLKPKTFDEYVRKNVA